VGERSWSDEVLVFYNFGAETDVAALLSAFRAAVVAKSNGHSSAERRLPHRSEVVCRNIVDVCAPEILEQVTAVRERVVITMQEVFQVPTHLPDFTLLSEMRVGDSHALHADGERHTAQGWRPNHTPWRTHVGLLYLNTSGVDYQGGLLRLPTISRTITPEKGMLVAFPSGHRHMHEVTTIDAGQRQSFTVWLTGNSSRVEPWSTERGL
jgi:predicted 2-oxoglutarate/Fe(II)-dependent dioxygenase YbiX